MKLSILSTIALVSLVFTLPITYAGENDKILLKTPIAFSTELPGLGSPIVRVAEDLEQISGKRIRMKVYEPNKLIAPFEILDAVSSGN